MPVYETAHVSQLPRYELPTTLNRTACFQHLETQLRPISLCFQHLGASLQSLIVLVQIQMGEPPVVPQPNHPMRCPAPSRQSIDNCGTSQTRTSDKR